MEEYFRRIAEGSNRWGSIGLRLLIFAAIIALLGCILASWKELTRQYAKSIAWKLISLRLVSVLLFLLLIARPFVDQNRLDKSNLNCSIS